MAFGMQALRDAKIDCPMYLVDISRTRPETRPEPKLQPKPQPEQPLSTVREYATPIEPPARVAETAAVAEGGDNSRHSNFPPAYPGKKLRPVKLKRFASLDPPTVVAVEGEDEEDATTEEGVPEARITAMKPKKKRTGNCCSSRPTTSA